MPPMLDGPLLRQLRQLQKGHLPQTAYMQSGDVPGLVQMRIARHAAKVEDFAIATA
jgi:hypothetical protein